MSQTRISEIDTPSAHTDPRGTAHWLYQPAWHWTLAFLLAGFYVASCAYIAAHRLLWFDEILTALITRLPTTGTMWKALSEVAEQTPPLYFLIARAFDWMFHHADIGLRVPSVLAFGVGLLVTFDIARRLTDGVYGLIAMSLAATPFVTYYGSEARSYALYFLLAAIALWLWLFTKTESKAAAVGFGAVFFLGLGIHYYVLLCLVPFGIMALAEKRPFHPKVLAASAGVLIALAALYPEIANSREFAKSVSAVWSPTLPALVAAHAAFLPNAILPLAVMGIALAARLKPLKDNPAPAMSAGERVSWLFLILPSMAFFLGCLVTHVFHDRYVIGAAPGVVTGAACLMWRHCRGSTRLSLALLLASAGSAVCLQVRTLRSIPHITAESGDYQERIRQMQALEHTILREGRQYAVLDWDVQYLETWYYSKHRDLYECITAERRWAIGKYVPLRFVSVEEIAAEPSQTALISPSPGLTGSLARAGVSLDVRVLEAQRVVYLGAGSHQGWDPDAKR